MKMERRATKKPDLTIIVPFLNEEETLPSFLAALEEKLPLFDGISLELVFIDDGSTDASVEIIRRYPHKDDYRARLVKLSRNFGAHEAFRAGLYLSQGSVVTSCSADLQVTFETLRRLYQVIQSGYDVAYAVKENNQSGVLSRLVSKTYAAVVRKTVTRLYPQTGADCFMLTRKVVNELNDNIEPNSSIMLQIFS